MKFLRRNSFLIPTALICHATVQAADFSIGVAPGARFRVVYDWSKEHCREWDVPDAPLRAFRSATGDVVAFASSDENEMYEGHSLNDIRQTCHSSLPSQENADPSQYSGSRFITATWTDDGRRVFALIHNEYHADRFHRCAFSSSMACWYTTIIAASSKDSGKSFSVSTPPEIVAGVPYRQEVEQGRHRGFFNPSNIVRAGQYWYMLTDTTGLGSQKPGLCLFRTADIQDPTSWRGYDGAGFTARGIDAYRQDPAQYTPCKPVDNLSTIGSISLHRPSGRFLAVLQGPDTDRKDGQIAFSWSDDLIHWEKPRNLLAISDMSSKNCSDDLRYGYPSVLDPDSPARNFDVIGDTPMLFLTRFHVSDCAMTSNRDLLKIGLEILPHVDQSARAKQ